MADDTSNTLTQDHLDKDSKETNIGSKANKDDSTANIEEGHEGFNHSVGALNDAGPTGLKDKITGSNTSKLFPELKPFVDITERSLNISEDVSTFDNEDDSSVVRNESAATHAISGGIKDPKEISTADVSADEAAKNTEGERNVFEHTTHRENKAHEQSDTILNKNTKTDYTLPIDQLESQSTVDNEVTQNGLVIASGIIVQDRKGRDSVAKNTIITDQNGMEWTHGLNDQTKHYTCDEQHVASLSHCSPTLTHPNSHVKDVISGNNQYEQHSEASEEDKVDVCGQQFNAVEKSLPAYISAPADNINQIVAIDKEVPHDHILGHNKLNGIQKTPPVNGSTDTSLHFKKPMADNVTTVQAIEQAVPRDNILGHKKLNNIQNPPSVNGSTDKPLQFKKAMTHIVRTVQAKETIAPILSTSVKDAKDKSKRVTRFLVTDTSEDYSEIENITSSVEPSFKSDHLGVMEMHPSVVDDMTPDLENEMIVEQATLTNELNKRKVQLVVPESEPKLYIQQKLNKMSISLDKDTSKPSIIHTKVKKSPKHDVSTTKLIYQPQFSLQMREHSKVGSTWAARPTFLRSKSEKEMAVRRSKSEGVISKRTTTVPRVRSASTEQKAYRQKLTRKKSTHTPRQPMMHAFGTPRQEKQTSVTPRSQGYMTPSQTPRQKTQTSLRSTSQATRTPTSTPRQKTQTSITSTIQGSETPTRTPRETTQTSITSIKQLYETPTSIPRQKTQTSMLSRNQTLETPTDIYHDKTQTSMSSRKQAYEAPAITPRQKTQTSIIKQTAEMPSLMLRDKTQISIQLESRVNEKTIDDAQQNIETPITPKAPGYQPVTKTPRKSVAQTPQIKHKPKLPQYLEEKSKQRLTKPQKHLSPRVKNREKENVVAKIKQNENIKHSDIGKKSQGQRGDAHMTVTRKEDLDKETHLAQVKAEQTYMVLSKPGFQAPPTIKLYQKLQNIRQKDTLPQSQRIKDEDMSTGVAGSGEKSSSKHKQISDTGKIPKRRESLRKPLFLDKFYSPSKSPSHSEMKSVGQGHIVSGIPKLQEKSYSFITSASRSRSRSQSESPGRSRISPRKSSVTTGTPKLKPSTTKSKSQTAAELQTDLDHIARLETENTDEFFDRLEQIKEETMKYEMNKVKHEEIQILDPADSGEQGTERYQILDPADSGEQGTERYQFSQDKEDSDERSSRKSRYDEFVETKGFHDGYEKEHDKPTDSDIYKDEMIGTSAEDLSKENGKKQTDTVTDKHASTGEIKREGSGSIYIKGKEETEDQTVSIPQMLDEHGVGATQVHVMSDVRGGQSYAVDDLAEGKPRMETVSQDEGRLSRILQLDVTEFPDDVKLHTDHEENKIPLPIDSADVIRSKSKESVRKSVSELNAVNAPPVTPPAKDVADAALVSRIDHDSDQITGIVEDSRQESTSPGEMTQQKELGAKIPLNVEDKTSHEQSHSDDESGHASVIKQSIEESPIAATKQDDTTTFVSDQYVAVRDSETVLRSTEGIRERSSVDDIEESKPQSQVDRDEVKGKIDNVNIVVVSLPAVDGSAGTVIKQKQQTSDGITDSVEMADVHVDQLDNQDTTRPSDVGDIGRNESPGTKVPQEHNGSIHNTAEQTVDKVTIIAQTAPLSTELDHVGQIDAREDATDETDNCDHKQTTEKIEAGGPAYLQKSGEIELPEDTSGDERIQPHLDDITETALKHTDETIVETTDIAAVEKGLKLDAMVAEEKIVEVAGVSKRGMKTSSLSTHVPGGQAEDTVYKSMKVEHPKTVSDETKPNEVTDADSIDHKTNVAGNKMTVEKVPGMENEESTRAADAVTAEIMTVNLGQSLEMINDNVQVETTDTEVNETRVKTLDSKVSKTVKSKTKDGKKKLTKKKKMKKLIPAKKDNVITVLDVPGDKAPVADNIATDESTKEVSEAEDGIKDGKVDQLDEKIIDKNKLDEKIIVENEVDDNSIVENKLDENIIVENKEDEKIIVENKEDEKIIVENKEDEKEQVSEETKTAKQKDEDDIPREKGVKRKHREKPVHSPRGELKFQKDDGRETRRWGRREFSEIVDLVMLANKGSDEETVAEGREKKPGEDHHQHSSRRHHKHQHRLSQDSTFVEDNEKAATLYSRERSKENWSRIRTLDYYSIKEIYKDKPVTRSKSNEEKDSILILHDKKKRQRRSRRDKSSGSRKRELIATEFANEQEITGVDINGSAVLLDKESRKSYRKSRHSKGDQNNTEELDLGNTEQNQGSLDQKHERKHRKSRHSRREHSDINAEKIPIPDSINFDKALDVDGIEEHKPQHESRPRESRRKIPNVEHFVEPEQDVSQERKNEVEKDTDVHVNDEYKRRKERKSKHRHGDLSGEYMSVRETLFDEKGILSVENIKPEPTDDKSVDKRSHSVFVLSKRERGDASRDSQNDGDDKKVDEGSADRKREWRHRRSRHSRTERRNASREIPIDSQDDSEEEAMDTNSTERQHERRRRRSRHSRTEKRNASREKSIDVQSGEERKERADSISTDRQHVRGHRSRHSRRPESIASRETNIDLQNVYEHERVEDISLDRQHKSRHRSRHSRRAERIDSKEKTIDIQNDEHEKADGEHESRHRSSHSRREKKIDSKEKTIDLPNDEHEKADDISVDRKHESRHRSRHSRREKSNVSNRLLEDSRNEGEEKTTAEVSTNRRDTRYRTSRHSRREESNSIRENTIDSLNEENVEKTPFDKHQERRNRISRHSRREDSNISREKTFDSLNAENEEEIFFDKHQDRKNRRSRHSRREGNNISREKTFDSINVDENEDDIFIDKNQDRRNRRSRHSRRDGSNKSREKTFDSLNVEEHEDDISTDKHPERRRRKSRHSRGERRSVSLEYNPGSEEPAIPQGKTDIIDNNTITSTDIYYDMRHKKSRHSRAGHRHSSRELTSEEIGHHQILSISEDDTMDYMGRKHSRKSRHSRREHSTASLEYSIISETGDCQGEIDEGNYEIANVKLYEKRARKSRNFRRERSNASTEYLPGSTSADVHVDGTKNMEEVNIVSTSDIENERMLGRSEQSGNEDGNAGKQVESITSQLDVERESYVMDEGNVRKPSEKESKKKLKKAKRPKRDASKGSNIKKEKRKI
ncbi:titin-like [Gigantopelta aegis]|uniref:titin-like n=1 Tax=Gigantopelta aegis TaxID=1735272 RepID=UPI001B88B8D9|nr:titin-like [Gigantopelta aegis]